VYVAATAGRVEGVIEGDLVITAGDLTISGTVEGDVLSLTSGIVRLEPGGVVEGSFRSVGPQIQIDGDVHGDLFATGIAVGVGSTGTVDRDVIMFGGTLTIDGIAGRDVRGRMISTEVSGSVGRDVDIAVERLSIRSGATVGGDVLYRSVNGADIAAGTVDGQIVVLPAQSNFVFGVILALANLIGFLAFIVAGVVLLWLFRGTGEAAVEAVRHNPGRSFLVGLGAMVGGPLLILILAVTLVGLPLAALLLVAMLLAFVFGPIPAVGAAGALLLRRKGGIFGGFVVGAVVWRLGIWLIPIVGALIYLVGLIWGVGGWVLGGWRTRSARTAAVGGPPSGTVVEEIPEGWEYPLPPASPSVLADPVAPVTQEAGEAQDPQGEDPDADRPSAVVEDGEPGDDGDALPE
jgi:cytoskeletal protein CcmA (bactofilin family)